MCGITGVSLTRGTVDAATLRAANRAMRHRGPDADGTFRSRDGSVGLAMVRLAITDTAHRSDQPMLFADGAVALVFNGEIYNYRELRDELAARGCTFRTTSDTEVLGELYLAYGTAMLEKLEGMYAFALYDARSGETLIARDVIGQKPLVYGVDATGFYFASEIPSLLALRPSLATGVDTAAIGVYLTQNFNHLPQPLTTFTQIRKLRPGHFLRIRKGVIVADTQYYRLRRGEPGVGDESDFLFTIIGSMRPSDVSFSSFLSGGNDSALVCAALRETGSRVDAYTLRVAKHDVDVDRSRVAAKTLHLNHHVRASDPRRFLELVEEQVRTLGEPYFHRTTVYADELLADVQGTHKVIFTGAGGDEVYYGYDNSQFLALGALLHLGRVVPLRPFARFVPERYRFAFGANLHTVKRAYYAQNYAHSHALFASDPKAVDAYFKGIVTDVFAFAEIRTYLDLSYTSGLLVENSHSLTIQGDLAGMRHSIEVRCPFLERRVIERGFRLPLRKKLGLNLREGKRVIKQSLVRYLPRSFVYAKKTGFGVGADDHDVLLQLHGRAIRRRLERLAARDGFNRDAIRALVANDDALRRSFTLVMKLYALECWYEAFVDARSPRAAPVSSRRAVRRA